MARLKPIPDAFRRILMLGLFAAAVCAWLLFEIAEEVRLRQPLVTLDLRLFQWLQEMRTAPADAFFLAVTHLGDPLVLAVAVAAAAIFLLIARRRLEALFLAGGFAGVMLAVAAVKWLMPRPRPLLLAGIEGGSSFPSGHASSSMVVYVFLAYLIARHVRGMRLGLPWLAAGIALALLISMSRLYLGAHWLSDVLGGYALAGVWLSLLVAGMEACRRR